MLDIFKYLSRIMFLTLAMQFFRFMLEDVSLVVSVFCWFFRKIYFPYYTGLVSAFSVKLKSPCSGFNLKILLLPSAVSRIVKVDLIKNII
jgi:hypothetical protein